MPRSRVAHAAVGRGERPASLLAPGPVPASGRALTLALALGGCEGAPAGFVAVDRAAQSPDSVRLTWSPGDDRAPAWLGDDTVVYAAAGFQGLPPWRGLIAAVPRQGGALRLIVSVPLDSTISRWLTSPTLVRATGGDHLAYLSPERINAPPLCGSESYPAPPPLAGGRLLTGAPQTSLAVSPDSQLVVTFADIEEPSSAEMPIAGVPDSVRRFRVHLLPFQLDSPGADPLPFRPSWSPDGRTLAFSNGIRLFTWSPGSTPVPIPGGDGLAAVAWSPRGDWLAAAKGLVSDSTVIRASYSRLDTLQCIEVHVTYTVPLRRLVLIRPDGSEQQELAEGDEPAWAPDGATVYVARNDAIWRVPLDGSAATPVARTAGGQEPAVSPDGRWLAFTRATTAGDHDIYVVRLPY